MGLEEGSSRLLIRTNQASEEYLTLLFVSPTNTANNGLRWLLNNGGGNATEWQCPADGNTVACSAT